MFLFVNGQMISSGVGDGSFLSTGNTPNSKDPNTQADAVWTKYTIQFTGTGNDTIKFEEDISAQGVADGETNVPFDSNSILADISLNSVPVAEVSPLAMVGVALVGAIGFTMFRCRKFAIS